MVVNCSHRVSLELLLPYSRLEPLRLLFNGGRYTVAVFRVDGDHAIKYHGLHP